MHAGVQIFDCGPGNRQAVVGRSAAADFIQQDERAIGRSMQDRGRLGHLYHEGGAPAGQIVAGADAREDAVHHAETRRTSRNKRAHLRKDDDQRRLPQVGRFAAHVRPGQQKNCVRGCVQVKIVGHKALAAASQFLLLDHGMAAFDDFEITGVAARLGVRRSLVG